ncbi:MAG: Stp1/IreP family PP2C-type Ser/Thr phosphatase, partial [Myxococcota bacterium]
MTVFGLTDVGQIREHNEDNLILADLTAKTSWRDEAGKREVDLDAGGLLMVVCDGMGGAAAGEVASQLATDIIFERMRMSAGHGDRDKLAIDIVRALEVAGARILDESTSNRACRGMGTTATVAALVDDHLLLGQVGDSRAYILRDEQLVQVTRDQSLVNQLIEAGQLTEEEAENFEHSNIILQALGTAETVQVDLTYARLRRGDLLMMCSDGLSGMIRDHELRDTLVHVDDVEEACRVLVDDANQAGGHDNITVVCAQFDGEGLRPPAPPPVGDDDGHREGGPQRRVAEYPRPPPGGA